MSKTALDFVNELIFELEAATASSVPSNAAAATAVPSASTSAAVPMKDADKEELTVNSLDLRVGLIRKVWRHETAEKLYCEEIDVGEDVPRQIASGLVPHYDLAGMTDRRLIVVCNLKPRSLVGFKSSGMVLCAAKTVDGVEKVEFVDPPVDAAIGERIVGLGLGGEPLSQKQCDKRKAFEVIAPNLTVNADGVATWNGLALVSAQGKQPCTAPTLREALIR